MCLLLFFSSDFRVLISSYSYPSRIQIVQFISRKIFHKGFNKGNTFVTKLAISSSLLKKGMLFRVIVS